MNKVLIAMVAAAAALTLTACGKDNDSKAESESKAETTQAVDTVTTDDETTSAEDETTTEEEETATAEEDEVPEGMIASTTGSYAFMFREDAWDAVGEDGLGYKLTHKLEESEVENYSYQLVINAETSGDIDEIADAVKNLYNGIATFEEPVTEEVNDIEFKVINGELLGDGSAALADLKLMFAQPEGIDDVLVLRYTTISMGGDRLERAEKDIEEVVNSVKVIKAE